MKTKYKFDSLKALFCSDNNDCNFISDFKEMMQIYRKTDEAVATLQPVSGDF